MKYSTVNYMEIENTHYVFNLPDFIILYSLSDVETRIFIKEQTPSMDDFDVSVDNKYISLAYHWLVTMGLTTNKLILDMEDDAYVRIP